MKRYLVFSFDQYYPSGGWDDFRKDFDTIEEAIVFINKLVCRHKQIIDTKTGEKCYY